MRSRELLAQCVHTDRGMDGAKLSRELRTANGDYLSQRRKIVSLGLVASTSMGLIALYQTGVIRRLPDLPGRWFDAAKVDASEEAYSYFSTPDGTLGLGSYAATVVLAAMGGMGRARTKPWAPLALFAKVVADAAVAAKLTRDQWAKHKAFCIWCLVAAGATFATVPLAFPEARAALRVTVRAWRRRRRR